MPSLDLTCRCDCTTWGQSVAVIGSWNCWKKTDFTVLKTSDAKYPKWTAAVPIPDKFHGQTVEFKYVVSQNGQICSWESNVPHNRVVFISDNPKSDDVYGQIPVGKGKPPPSTSTSNAGTHHHTTAAVDSSGSALESSVASPYNGDVGKLDTFEKEIVRITNEQKSWRQRLAFVRSLFTEQSVADKADFDYMSIDSLATVSVYLTFLSSGQVRCDEDGGHHRPNHHAHEARRIEFALARVIYCVSQNSSTLHSKKNRRHAFLPYVVRKIFPLLPSYSSQFTVSVPLTRIRDIAHRGDIPRDLKQEIKHTLQNKLHRCAGPEDLHTSAGILERISHGGYSTPFVDQFRIFHAELQSFFNAASLDDRLRYLQVCQHTRPAASYAGALLGLKRNYGDSLAQLQSLTTLREAIMKLDLLSPKMLGLDDEAGPNGHVDVEKLPNEDVQKTRLADVELESYAFVQLAAEAKSIEASENPESFQWSRGFEALSLAVRNMQYSSLRAEECRAAGNELLAVSREFSNGGKHHDYIFLRAKAAVERIIRFAQEFSDTVLDVFTRRAHRLGTALSVDQHSVSVYAEGEIRSNVMFQMSRIATACNKMCRRKLKLPPWDALNVGEANGRVVYVEDLSEIIAGRSLSDGTPLIVVAKSADGDEDIPTHVKGIVVARPLPHLSHLGLRARQAGVAFVCAEEREAFNKVWGKCFDDGAVLTVTEREGLKRLEGAKLPSRTSAKTADASAPAIGHGFEIRANGPAGSGFDNNGGGATGYGFENKAQGATGIGFETTSGNGAGGDGYAPSNGTIDGFVPVSANGNGGDGFKSSNENHTVDGSVVTSSSQSGSKSDAEDGSMRSTVRIVDTDGSGAGKTSTQKSGGGSSASDSSVAGVVPPDGSTSGYGLLESESGNGVVVDGKDGSSAGIDTASKCGGGNSTGVVESLIGSDAGMSSTKKSGGMNSVNGKSPTKMSESGNNASGIVSSNGSSTGADGFTSSSGNQTIDGSVPVGYGQKVSETSMTVDLKEKRVIHITEATRHTASSKSTFAGLLLKASKESNGLFQAPDGSAIPHGVFHGQRQAHHVEYDKVVQKYDAAHKKGDESVDSHAEEVSELVRNKFTVDETVIESMQKSFKKGSRIMVRSSANAEDLETMSGAGLYDSIANVSIDHVESFVKAVKSVWSSLWTKRAASSRAGYGVPHERVSMAVLVQEMIYSQLSFIAFSSVTVDGRPRVYVEMAVGMGETLASATADGSPYRFHIGREDLLVEDVSFASYSEGLVPQDDDDKTEDATSTGLRPTIIDYSEELLTTDMEWRHALVKRIAKTALLLEKTFERPQDIEGSVTVDKSGETQVYVVQARPQVN